MKKKKGGGKKYILSNIGNSHASREVGLRSGVLQHVREVQILGSLLKERSEVIRSYPLDNLMRLLNFFGPHIDLLFILSSTYENEFPFLKILSNVSFSLFL